MALTETEKWFNVESSILKYADTNLKGTENLTVDLYEAAKFNPKNAFSWAEVRVFPMEPTQEFRLADFSGNAGEDARVMININIYVKVDLIPGKAPVGGVLEATRLMDVVHNYFRFKVEIPIFIFPGGSSQVENIFILESKQQNLGIRKDTEIGTTLNWRNVTAIGRWDKIISTT